MNTSTMTAAARLAARLLAHRRTAPDEVGDLIRNVHDALARLGEAPEVVAAPPEDHEMVQPAPRPRQKRQPRREAVVTADAAAVEVPAAPPPAPKLVRRAEMVPTAPAGPVMVGPLPHQGALRGVVRWFDPKSGKGALRLPGLGDVAFEARLLAESGITRLFKGQEVEATLAASNGTPHLQRLSIPGSVSANPLGGGVVKGRHARPVVVELKREALRRAAARAEAEHVLGTNRTR
jgi:cold shock CspA family protein